MKSIIVGIATALFSFQATADELSELTARESLTPEALVAHFSDFKFELSKAPQNPETFLARKRGDCDDFARLAQRLLRKHGYTTKLVVVRMEKQTHVVCFVQEVQGYLDFNLRSSDHPITPSDGSLEDIGEKVAGYFRGAWTMVSEIEYENGRARYLNSVFH